jgi:multidrug efflux pump
LALSLGDASTSRVPLGVVIVGGVMFSLVLTLYVIPAMFSYLSRQKKHIDFGLNETVKEDKELVYEG